uniref:Uncharacterized protein n=1 Tax=Anguilla anguilla TaxID=7936 RepID=A0A0E9V0N7_ANGAN
MRSFIYANWGKSVNIIKHKQLIRNQRKQN